MLSILIPTYNYNVLPLVETLYGQAGQLNIDFEIRVYDDHSPQPKRENSKIQYLSHCTYKILPENIGRSAIRNLLAREAIFDTLLFLDADTLPVEPEFLKNYVHYANQDTQVVYGGIVYQQEKPGPAKMLRWKYGRAREALSIFQRQQRPYLRFLTLNFLIKKSVFETVKFNTEIPNLRHEDTLFARDLQENNISIAHIGNPVMHLGLESSAVFLEKSLASVHVLHDFLKSGLVKAEGVKLTRVANRVENWGAGPIVRGLFESFEKPMRKNLLAPDPSLFLFDFYRLGYLLDLKKQHRA